MCRPARKFSARHLADGLVAFCGLNGLFASSSPVVRCRCWRGGEVVPDHRDVVNTHPFIVAFRVGRQPALKCA